MWAGRRLISLLIVTVLTASCTTSSYDTSRRAESMETSRIRSVVLHFTQEDDDRSLELLTEADYPVSSHYLVSSTNQKGRTTVFQLVAENDRAWHAGFSTWRKRTNLNDTSIGIEIVYEISCLDPLKTTYDSCLFPQYHPLQIERVIDLLTDILKRHPDIKPLNIVGHSDIAPTRKIDPGPNFPWHYLYTRGIGAWFEDAVMLRYLEHFQIMMPAEPAVDAALVDIGYGFETAAEKTAVIRAFQAHFVPHQISGIMDPLTAAALFALRERYEANSDAYSDFCRTSDAC